MIIFGAKNILFGLNDFYLGVEKNLFPVKKKINLFDSLPKGPSKKWSKYSIEKNSSFPAHIKNNTG